MARQRRVTATRSPKKRSAAPPARAGRRANPAPAGTSPHTGRPPAPAPPAKKPGYYEAISLYESGVRALQKHEFAIAADHFRAVLQRYPDERELVERARLYLRVCERETARRPAGPQTPEERIYAATVALNAGDASVALAHLRQALADKPDSDHGHYIMAVALSENGNRDDALDHLRKAIALNPDNRSLARQDPDLSSLRELAEFRELLDAQPGRRRVRARTGVRP